jgi:hypothetical protein
MMVLKIFNSADKKSMVANGREIDDPDRKISDRHFQRHYPSRAFEWNFSRGHLNASEVITQRALVIIRSPCFSLHHPTHPGDLVYFHPAPKKSRQLAMVGARFNGVYAFPARTIFLWARIQGGLNFSTRSREVNQHALKHSPIAH